MTIFFKVVNQTIRLANPDPNVMQDVVSDSVGYLYVKFTFSSDWDNLVRSAVFVAEDGTAIRVPLVDDMCLVPHEVIKAPCVHISAYGATVAGELIELPTSKFDLKIKQAGLKDGEDPIAPTPSEYATIIGIMQQQAIDATRAEAAAIEAQSYAKFGTFSLVGNMLVATIEAADNITDITINDQGELVITVGD